jgi:Platelet-activating factor acetylhydrolase, isoform II
LRDARHRDQLRITVWYPATADSVEVPLVLGPPDQPVREVGAVAPDAPLATDSERRPVILLSHGFGGSARIMGWFGIAMARHGYVVIAVDHPGNNGIDEMTVPGAILYWDRADDLRAALEAVEHDPVIGPHLDLNRLGVADFFPPGDSPRSSRAAPGPIRLTSRGSARPNLMTGSAGRSGNLRSRLSKSRTPIRGPRSPRSWRVRGTTTPFQKRELSL